MQQDVSAWWQQLAPRRRWSMDGMDAAGGDAAGSVAQVLATGLTNLLKTGASRSVLCSL